MGQGISATAFQSTYLCVICYAVFQMTAVKILIPLLWLLLLWPLCILGKCIFDEVQSSVRVVSPSMTPPSMSDGFSNEFEVKDKLPVIAPEDDGLTQKRHRATSPHSQSHRAKTTVEGQTKDFIQAQPIRIRTWTPTENTVISPWVRQRVEAAVSEAISTVSNLLSGNVWQKTLLLMSVATLQLFQSIYISGMYFACKNISMNSVNCNNVFLLFYEGYLYLS